MPRLKILDPRQDHTRLRAIEIVAIGKVALTVLSFCCKHELAQDDQTSIFVRFLKHEFFGRITTEVRALENQHRLYDYLDSLSDAILYAQQNFFKKHHRDLLSEIIEIQKWLHEKVNAELYGEKQKQAYFAEIYIEIIRIQDELSKIELSFASSM